ncbi:MarR family transcriptional regulator [Citricoccus sp. NPDC055426]|uniref:MarR family winged helix-turn-helix transcriptional regulator n=1 Tax=Citricoccus sp. NPDC055426 TaxID=3155536 RepID=UPI00344AA108
MDSIRSMRADEKHTTDHRAVELWGRVINGFEVTNRRLHDAIDREFSLTAAETQVLLNLHRQPGHRAPMAKLAQAASFSTGGFTKLADKLTKRGYVTRAACSDDRRVTFLEFTPEGLEVAGRLTAMAARTNHEVFIDVLGEQRAAQVAEAMTELFRANAPAMD